MIKTVEISDGRKIDLIDLDEMTPDQVLVLATAAADLLIRSGMIRDDVGLSGVHLVQFLSQMADTSQSKDVPPIVGLMEVTGSKHNLAYATVSANEPYEHEVRIQIVAMDDQDTDAFVEALDKATTGPVTINARNESGYLVCTTNDIIPR